CEVTVYSDSKYVVDSIQKGWLLGWRKNGWKNSQKKTPPNIDLWQLLLEQLGVHKVSFVWIRGHDGHTFNERCDRLAVQQYTVNK
ncbi:MAG: ribonuclease H, partial [Oscillospiraceae bacterium]